MPRSCPIVLFAVLTLLARTKTPAAEVESLPADKEPVLRVDAGGPSAFVTALAFSPDGKTLYAGGWDKVIRVWTQNNEGVFQLSRTAFRVPVGPGVHGAINALALSPDGDWLAAAGYGMFRQLASFRQLGFIVPAFGVRDPIVFRDMGTIYLFNTRDRSVRTLRGHRGYVTALTFGPQQGKAIPPLLSVAVEEKEGNTVEMQLTARLWDANKGESLAVLPELPSREIQSLLPGVAMWQSGEGVGGLRAALALYDGNLRLLQPTGDRFRLEEVEDVAENLVVAHLGNGRLLTAGYDQKSRQGYLSRWLAPPKGEPKRERWGVLGDGIPRALALLSGQADGVADGAAVLVRVSGQKGAAYQYRLRIVELKDEKLRVVNDMLLWRDAAKRQLPMAASVRGRHLAVANNADHTIHVYRVRDLGGDDSPKKQILAGGAAFFRHASFIRRGKNLGLLLKRDLRKTNRQSAPPPDGEKTNWVLDFGRRRLRDDLADWEPARPRMGRWQARLDAEQRVFTILDGDEKIATIAVPKKEFVTAYALMPPSESTEVPLLAVASHENGQPILAIFNAKSGEKLRHFTGHTERLRSVAFAPDGRLLVSAADDGTVCVWSLTDLHTIRGKHGRLPGLTVGRVEKGAKGVKVLEVTSDSPVRGKLKRGDVLAGLVEQKKLRPIDSPRAFYEALYKLRPGTEVRLRRGDDDIAVVVGQGVDERKPLFSLFVIDAAKVSECEWIGWSPVGPYEASSPKAEKYLGWHFNTGDPKAPTRFADAGQYRKFYYRQNLLDQLIQRGALGRLDSPQLPAPVLALWVEDDGRLLSPAEQETLVVRRPRIDVKASLFERPLSSLSALSWRLDDGVETPFDLNLRGEASFRVPVTLARGEHRFVVTARTWGESQQLTRKSLMLRYQPLPPEIAYKSADQQLRVRQEDFTLEIDIIPKVGGENVRVTIDHKQGKEKSHTQTFAGRAVVEGAVLHIEHRLKLRPGNNDVEVSAVNGGPAGGSEKESARRKLSVFYYFKAKPPVIAFQKVVPVSASKEEPLSVDVSRPMLVRHQVVKLVGQIKAEEEPLTEALWERGKSTPAKTLDGFKPGKHTFSFEQRIPLEPGPQIVRFRARTEHSDEAEHNLTLDYQPPVPVVSRFAAPRDGEVFEGVEETKAIRVRCEFSPLPGAQDFNAAILVNGKPVLPPPEIDKKAGTIVGTVAIRPGESGLRVEVSNKWGASYSSETITVRYVRPPVLVGRLTYKSISGTPFIKLKAEVRSGPPLERESVRLQVNGNPFVPQEQEIQIDKGEQNRWTVQLLRVPLDAGSGEQKIALHLANTEAPLRSPADLTIQSEKVLSAPEAEFQEPWQDKPFSYPRVTIRFHVRSVGKLETVRLLREGRPLRSFDPGRPPQNGEKHELTATTEVDLEPGLNHLSIEAISVSGRLPNSPRLVLTYTPPALRIVMENLTVQSADAAPANPPSQERGIIYFPEAASGHVWLHGRVFWTDKGENWQKDAFQLQVFVNGFQQIPHDVLREAESMETPFRIPLLLNRRKDNHIILVASRQDAGDPTEARANCTEPITAQRLHVLALSPHSEPDEVKNRLHKAIDDLQKERQGRPPAFKKVIHLPPLTGDRVQSHLLCSRVHELKQKIIMDRKYAASHKDALMNDVLMIYYEGKEKIDNKGHFFETYSPPGGSTFDMPCDKLAGYLETVPGAQVLLLDVDRPALEEQDPQDKIAFWKKTMTYPRAHVVVMRCARRTAPGRLGPVRLIPEMEKRLPQAARLSQLISLIEETLNAANNRGLLIFHHYLPDELAELMIGPASP